MFNPTDWSMTLIDFGHTREPAPQDIENALRRDQSIAKYELVLERLWREVVLYYQEYRWNPIESPDVDEFTTKVQRLYAFLLQRYSRDSPNIHYVQDVAKEFQISLHDIV
jgi:hypothetical protein